VGVPKKPTGFFWVRTRVSEPWLVCTYQGSQQEVVKFHDKAFSKFQDILKSQNVENHFVLCTTNQS